MKTIFLIIGIIIVLLLSGAVVVVVALIYKILEKIIEKDKCDYLNSREKEIYEYKKKQDEIRSKKH